MLLSLPNYLTSIAECQQILEFGDKCPSSEKTILVCARISNYHTLDLFGEGVIQSVMDRLIISLQQEFDVERSAILHTEDDMYFVVKDMAREVLYQKLFAIYRGLSLLAIPVESAAIARCQFLFCKRSPNWERSSFKEIFTAFVHSVTETDPLHYLVELPYEVIIRCYSDKLLNSEYSLLKQAVVQKKLVFAYQPIIASSTGDIEYYECLSRIPAEDGHLISAGMAIMEAESEGFINVIDHLVVDMAISELEIAQNISLSVNVSNHGVCDPHLLMEITERLKNQPSVAKRLIIEITETTLNEDYSSTHLFISTVHDLGCRIALDDFGGGFTSIRQLTKLPIDIIKIDGSFIKDIASNPENKIFVEELVKIADRLGKKTVAEFVENGEIAKILLNTNVDGMQGNFFSPAVNYRAWNKNSN